MFGYLERKVSNICHHSTFPAAAYFFSQVDSGCDGRGVPFEAVLVLTIATVGGGTPFWAPFFQWLGVTRARDPPLFLAVTGSRAV